MQEVGRYSGDHFKQMATTNPGGKRHVCYYYDGESHVCRRIKFPFSDLIDSVLVVVFVLLSSVYD